DAVRAAHRGRVRRRRGTGLDHGDRPAHRGGGRCETRRDGTGGSVSDATENPRGVALSETKRSLLAARLRQAATAPGGARPAVIRPRPPGTPVPLSHAQERLWFMEQFAPGTAAYTVP